MNKHDTKSKLLMQLTVSTSLIFGAGACTTIEKAQLNSKNPSDAITEVTQMRSELLDKQAELYAPDLYEEGVEELTEATEGLTEGESVSEVLDSAALAKAYFIKANQKKENLNLPEQLLEARKVAIAKGAKDNEMTSSVLSEIDEDLRDETDDFSKSLNADKYAKFQQRYLDLEVESVKNARLEAIRSRISLALDNNADDLAPNTLDSAKRELKTAENLISANVRKPEAYRNNLDRAEKASILLSDVMSKFEKMGEGMSEKAALTLVSKDRKIENLTDDIDSLHMNLMDSEYHSMTMQAEMAQQSEKLHNYSGKVEMQNTIDQARKKFDQNEAAVYQQGNSLIIRLKNMNFGFGSASLPEESYETLEKVKSVVKELNAPRLVVQGHTDSTGPVKVNDDLSEKRATTVAEYLSSDLGDSTDIQSVGYGEKKPLVSNNTKAGRAQNRRVDIVVSTTR